METSLVVCLVSCAIRRLATVGNTKFAQNGLTGTGLIKGVYSPIKEEAMAFPCNGQSTQVTGLFKEHD
jgi:hypothetical protein